MSQRGTSSPCATRPAIYHARGSSRVPSDPQQPLETPSGKVSAKEAFIAYVKRESDILQLADSGRSGDQNYVNYESGYPIKNGSQKFS